MAQRVKNLPSVGEAWVWALTHQPKSITLPSVLLCPSLLLARPGCHCPRFLNPPNPNPTPKYAVSPGFCTSANYLLLFSRSVMSDSLRPLGLQHSRLPCPSLSPRVCSNSYPLSLWCHPTISSSVTPFSCHQSFPESGSFPTNQLFTSGGQSIGASASIPVFPMNIQDWFPLGLTGLIPLLSKGFSRVFSSTQFESINSLALSLPYGPILTFIHDYWKKP